MILVTGSTGVTGGATARALIAQGVKPRLLVRDPAKAKAFEGKAEIVKGDLNDAASLAAALVGVEKFFLVTAGLDGPRLESAAIDAAKAAGVKHLVKLSVLGAQYESISFAKHHRANEKKIEASGIAWTHVRPGNFMTNSFGWAGTIKASGGIFSPVGEGKFAPIDPDDIGAVVAKVLTSAGHAGQAYDLTGPQSLTTAEQAAIFAKVLGRKVFYQEVPAAAARDGMLGAGMPPAYVDGLLELFAIMKSGGTNVVTDTVEKLTGKKPNTLENWVKANAAAFA